MTSGSSVKPRRPRPSPPFSFRHNMNDLYHTTLLSPASAFTSASTPSSPPCPPASCFASSDKQSLLHDLHPFFDRGV